MNSLGAHGSGGTLSEEREKNFAKMRKDLTSQQKRVRCLFDEALNKRASKLDRKDGVVKGGRLLSLDGGGIKVNISLFLY